MGRVRIVEEISRNGNSHFFVEDSVEFMRIVLGWSRPHNFGFIPSENINLHWTKQKAEQWIESRQKYRDKRIKNLRGKEVIEVRVHKG